MNVKKLGKLFFFKPDNIVMNTLEVTTQICGFNQRLPMWNFNKQFPYSGTHRHKDDDIDIFF